MKNLNLLYTIGAIGMVVTATLQMMFSTMLARPLIHPTFFALYPIFITFLAIGHFRILKTQKALLAQEMLNAAK